MPLKLVPLDGHAFGGLGDFFVFVLVLLLLVAVGGLLVLGGQWLLVSLLSHDHLAVAALFTRLHGRLLEISLLLFLVVLLHMLLLLLIIVAHLHVALLSVFVVLHRSHVPRVTRFRLASAATADLPP